MKRLLFVYNPHAGQSKVKGKLSDIVDAFTYHGYLPSVYPTRGMGDATQVVRGIGKHYGRVVCCGGDGTLHEVVTALMEMESPPVLGYIPAGTTNDFSRNLNLPRDMALAANVAVTGETVCCDMGRFNDAYFVYVAAFGAFTDVSYDTPQQFKNMLGHLAYILEGIGHLGNIRSWHMKVKHDQGEVEGDFIFGMVSNTRSVGGFKLWREDEVQLDDGAFEVVLVRTPKNALELQAILHSLVTQASNQDGPLLAFHSQTLTVECDEAVAWTLDGEYGGSPQSVEIENVQKALEICGRTEE